MESIKTPFRGIKNDVRGRLACYKQDWVNGIKSGVGILGPTASTFFASALPAIAFGELLNMKTGRRLSSVQTLFSAAICGVIHTLVGGQPLLIQGVAEPTVLMYTFLYDYAENRDDLYPLFLAWTAWVCVWTAFLLMLMSIFNVCAIIDRFTRIAEELIEMLISVLFIQEAIRGIVTEFQVPKGVNEPNNRAYQFQWRYANGLFAILFSLGFIYTAFKSRKARSWLYGTGGIRNFIGNFGVPMMILAWAGLSYAVPGNVPTGVPRRLFSPHPWHSWDTWSVASRMGDVPVRYIFGAIIPGTMIAVLFFFEHNVASKMAQQKEFNLKHPSAYHYDVFLLGIMTLICGLLGLPPSYALLPQSPMHIKSLAVLKRQLIRRKMVETAKESIHKRATNSEIYGNMQAVFLEMDRNKSVNRVVKELETLKEVVMKGESDGKDTFDPEKHIENHLPVRVNEQRLSNLLQSLLLGVAVFAMPALKRLPSSLLWGYIAYMAIDSLPGNQFWERIRLIFVNKTRLYKILARNHASYVETVPFRWILGFTLFQLTYLLVCYGMTWIPLVGIIFPLPFVLLIIIRHLVLPRIFDPQHLHDLDSHEYEEILGTSRRAISFRENGTIYEDGYENEEEMEEEISDSEVLDELTTNRGEIKIRTLSLQRFRSERRVLSGRMEMNPRAAMSMRHDRNFKVFPENIA
ncbi:probable boron transporter 7 [Spinacia oleracea]|uniref:Probable boron transporter 7 n=1 Tax=Spinacia oleracea TaxID=3562 RepID=A0A9R0IGI3_SPIOL|nr:probable boron transporter 7 [Spinacia oleracea]XP_021848226.2 probable boron transporter 7 [Spinacia oleracea]XP_056698816.1 probable boron transporter 7 [Spinacia oleracea]